MTTQVLYNEYFSVFRFPQRLMSDQGTGFTSKVIKAMCSLLGIEKIRMIPYHPQPMAQLKGFIKCYSE